MATPYKPNMFEQLKMLGVPETVMGIIQTGESIRQARKRQELDERKQTSDELAFAASAVQQVITQVPDPAKRETALKALRAALPTQFKDDQWENIITSSGALTEAEKLRERGVEAEVKGKESDTRVKEALENVQIQIGRLEGANADMRSEILAGTMDAMMKLENFKPKLAESEYAVNMAKAWSLLNPADAEQWKLQASTSQWIKSMDLTYNAFENAKKGIDSVLQELIKQNFNVTQYVGNVPALTAPGFLQEIKNLVSPQVYAQYAALLERNVAQLNSTTQFLVASGMGQLVGGPQVQATNPGGVGVDVITYDPNTGQPVRSVRHSGDDYRPTIPQAGQAAVPGSPPPAAGQGTPPPAAVVPPPAGDATGAIPGVGVSSAPPGPPMGGGSSVSVGYSNTSRRPYNLNLPATARVVIDAQGKQSLDPSAIPFEEGARETVVNAQFFGQHLAITKRNIPILIQGQNGKLMFDQTKLPPPGQRDGQGNTYVYNPVIPFIVKVVTADGYSYLLNINPSTGEIPADEPITIGR